MILELIQFLPSTILSLLQIVIARSMCLGISTVMVGRMMMNWRRLSDVRMNFHHVEIRRQNSDKKAQLSSI